MGEVPAKPVVTFGATYPDLYASKEIDQVLADNVPTTVSFDNLYGKQSGMSYAAGVFTATREVRYHITGKFVMRGTSAVPSINRYYVEIVTLATSVGGNSDDFMSSYTGTRVVTVYVDHIAEFQVGDTLSFEAVINTGGGGEVIVANLSLVPY